MTNPTTNATAGGGEGRRSGHRFPEGFGRRPTQEVGGAICYRCTICGEWKPPESFKVLKSTANGRRPACVPCHRQRQNAMARAARAKRRGLRPTQFHLMTSGRPPLPLPRATIARRFSKGKKSARVIGAEYGVTGETVLAITRQILGDGYAAAMVEKRARRRKPAKAPKPVRVVEQKPAVAKPKPRTDARYQPTPEDIAAGAKAVRDAQIAAMRAISSGRRAARELDEDDGGLGVAL